MSGEILAVNCVLLLILFLCFISFCFIHEMSNLHFESLSPQASLFSTITAIVLGGVAIFIWRIY